MPFCFSPSITFNFVKLSGTTSEQNNGYQIEDDISQRNLRDQTSNNKSE